MKFVARLRTAVIAAALCLVGVAAADSPQPARVALFVLHEGQCGVPQLRDGLRELGYRDGQNINIQCHQANGRFEDRLAVAQAMVHTKPHIIVARGHYMVEPAMQAIHDIPIVGIASGDPVSVGWAKSLAQPGGNFTGISYFVWELYAKRLEYLKALIPDLKRVGLLTQTVMSKSLTEMYLRTIREAAQTLGISVMQYDASDQAGIERAFESMARDKMQAAMVLGYVLYSEEGPMVAGLATMYGLPVMHFLHGYPSMGGLIGFGPDYPTLQRRLAIHVDKVLRGAKPANIPIEQPRDFRLTINLGVARELGLKVPESILNRADTVIE